MSHDPLDVAWKHERARIVGSLARRFRDLTIAEDAVQEAFSEAATRWPTDGTPDRPGAWLSTTAYRKAIGMIRRQKPTVDVDSIALPETPPADGAGAGALDNDLFGLILTCCHPALSPEARIALTLRHVCGLTTAEISAGFVTTEAAMAKRLVRARSKIRDAGFTFDPPSDIDIADRLDDIHTVIYLVFTEGYLASGEGPAVRADLCDEAIWLARQVHRLHPDDESTGLLALLLLHNARRDARQDETGRLVPLLEQARSTWDAGAIDEARELLAGSGRTTLGPYQVEAAIALLHVASAEPDWARIADLYGVLNRLAPSPVAQVNRAYAVGRADGPQAGLSILRPMLAGGELARYPSLHAVHADLLHRSGDVDTAIAAWMTGAAVADNPSHKAAMIERAQALETRDG